jgi:hypothetical protein
MFTVENKVPVPLHKVLALIILLLLFTINFLQAQPLEHQVKSQIIWQIADIYIKWPKETEMDNRDKPFVIGVVGENPFGRYLKKDYIRKQLPMRIRNKTVILRSIKRVEHIPGCHLLYVADLPRRFFSRVIEFIHDKPILTITDTEDYLDEGIHISFVVEKIAAKPVTGPELTDKRKSTFGLVINETAARQSGLRIGEGLLQTAKAVVYPYRPYQDIANYFDRFTLFTDWPPDSAAEDPSKPFKIEVLGENYFGSYLDEIFKSKKLKNKPVVIHDISNINEISSPHLLFISKSMKNKISEIIAYTKNKPILTIGNTRGFRQAGVHINFYYNRLILSFEINNDAVRAAGLNFSYHLSKMGKADTSH